MELRIGLGFLIDAFKLVKRRDQRFRHVTSAELAEIWSFVACQWGLFGCFHSCSCLYQSLHSLLMVGCGCDTFANQHRVGSGAGIILQLNRTEHSGFRYTDHIVRQISGQLVVFVHIDLEILEISCIDADDSRSRINGTLDFLTGMRFDQHRHIETMCKLKQGLELAVVQRGDDQ